MAVDERLKIKEYAKKSLAEIIERRAISSSTVPGGRSDEREWKLHGDVENWTVDELNDVMKRLNSVVEAPDVEPNVAACGEYLDKRENETSNVLRALLKQCRESEPLGITVWPAISAECRSEP